MDSVPSFLFLATQHKQLSNLADTQAQLALVIYKQIFAASWRKSAIWGGGLVRPQMQ